MVSLLGAGHTGPVIGLFYYDEYKEKDADIEIALPISGEISIKDAYIEVKTLPKCEVISATHLGPYYDMGKVYSQIFEYAEEHGLKLITPIRESYLKYIEEVPEDDLLTEIQCPFEDT